MTMRAAAASLICLLAILMVFQGGFFPEAASFILISYLVIAVILVVVARVKRQLPSMKSLRFWIVPASAFFIAALMAVSAFVHGLPLASLIECSPWLLAAAAAVVAGCLDERCYPWLMKGLAYLGIVSAVLGVALYAGMPYIGGTMNAGRLQFLFQYANAAGAWFAVAALFCLRSADGRLARCLLMPLVALLLTQSAGAILLFGIIFACCIAAYLIHERNPHAYAHATLALIQAVLAAVVFACLRVQVGFGVLVFLIAVIAVYEGWSRISKWLAGGSRSQCTFWIILIVGVLAACILAFMMLPRLEQAVATMGERLFQIRDALTLLTRDPLWGIGPDQWQHAYPVVQSVAYKSAVVHCGYLQLALDAGMLAPLSLLILMGFAIVRGQSALEPVFWFLASHSLIDFDLQFAFFPVLIYVLLSVSVHSISEDR